MWGMEIKLHILTSTLDGGEWSPLCCGGFIPREGAHSANWIGK